MSYQKITKEDFEKALPGKAVLSPNTNKSGEFIYEIPIDDKTKVMIYSSISRRSDNSRGVGEDAIRFALVDLVSGKAFGTKKVYRVPGWDQRMKERIVTLVKESYSVVRCAKCNSAMIRRKGRYGDFLGCGRYPNCKNTIKLS